MSNLGIDVCNLNASWNADAQKYERRQGGSTHAVAQYILSLAPSLSGISVVLDSCCGTGAFTIELVNAAAAAPPLIHAIDNSPGMIDITKSLVARHGWEKFVQVELMDAMDLRFPDDTFDLSVTSFGIFFFPDPTQGAKEIHRTLKPGGAAFVTCWKETSYMTIFHAVQQVVRPTKRVVLSMFETWSREETITKTLRKASFRDVELVSREVMIAQKDMDEAIEMLALRFHDFVRDEWTEEERKRLRSATREVMMGQGDALTVELAGAGIGLPMCAWIARGTK